VFCDTSGLISVHTCVSEPELTCAVPLIEVQSEAAVALAAEATDAVPAAAVRAQAVDHLTLVYICGQTQQQQSELDY